MRRPGPARQIGVHARRTGLARAELLRRGLRQLADRLLGDRAPGWSLAALSGALGDDPDLPADLAARHDDYLYGAAPLLKKRAK